jgi:hypothetical protein
MYTTHLYVTTLNAVVKVLLTLPLALPLYDIGGIITGLPTYVKRGGTSGVPRFTRLLSTAQCLTPRDGQWYASEAVFRMASRFLPGLRPQPSPHLPFPSRDARFLRAEGMWRIARVPCRSEAPLCTQ